MKKAQFFIPTVSLGLLALIVSTCKLGQANQTISKLPNHEENDSTQRAKELVALGKKLFFDRRLSSDESISCAFCHKPGMAFTDQEIVSEGVKGRRTLRNSPSLFNAGLLKTVMFDAHLPSLEMQAIVPIQEETEMDMKMTDLIPKLRKVEEYQQAAQKIFHRDFDAFVLTRSIAAFERTLISQNSRFDQFYRDNNKNALTQQEKEGWKLFSEVLYCTKCHPAPNFTTFEAENNGLYTDYGKDQGRFRIANDSTQRGKFKIPSLRNIEYTFPYMHDGSKATIEEVIQHYEKGGEAHPLKSKTIQPFTLNKKQRKQLKAFLYSLSDLSYLDDF